MGSLRAPFVRPSKAGHRKGRLRSSRLEEEYSVRFEAPTNML